MSKKLLSVVLALALVLSCFAVGASAVGGLGYEDEEDAALYTQTWALDEPVDNGDGTYTVNVRLTANYSVGPIEFTLAKTVNSGSLTLTKAVAGSAIPANWYALVSMNASKDKVTINPDPVEDAVAGIDNPSEAIIAVLTYTASSDVAATLAVNVADAKSQTNPGGTVIAARMSDSNVVTGTPIVGQTVNATNTVTIGGAAATTPPELVAIDGTLGVVDTSRTDLDADNEGTTCDGYLLGFDPDNNGSIEELFEVVGDGTMNIIASSEGSEAATGTMVQVLDLDDNVVAEYVVIVFGDANGDGFADTTDASILEEHDSWVYGEYGRLFTYQDFACDVNVDGAADTTDSSIIEEHDGWVYGDTGRIDVATVLAALGF